MTSMGKLSTMEEAAKAIKAMNMSSASEGDDFPNIIPRMRSVQLSRDGVKISFD